MSLQQNDKLANGNNNGVSTVVQLQPDSATAPSVEAPECTPPGAPKHAPTAHNDEESRDSAHSDGANAAAEEDEEDDVDDEEHAAEDYENDLVDDEDDDHEAVDAAEEDEESRHTEENGARKDAMNGDAPKAGAKRVHDAASIPVVSDEEDSTGAVARQKKKRVDKEASNGDHEPAAEVTE